MAARGDRSSAFTVYMLGDTPIVYCCTAGSALACNGYNASPLAEQERLEELLLRDLSSSS